jgi:purine-binding chemotaxis protein CheW
MSDDTTTLEPPVTIESVVAELDHLTPALPMSTDAAPGIETSDRIVVFELCGAVYGCALEHVSEVQRIPAMTRLPNTPEWLFGVSNLRGEVVSIVDWRAFFDLPEAGVNPHRRVLILRSLQEDLRVGVIVDKLIGLRTSSELHPANSQSTGGIDRYLRGVSTIQALTIGLIDVEQWIASDELRQFG